MGVLSLMSSMTVIVTVVVDVSDIVFLLVPCDGR